MHTCSKPLDAYNQFRKTFIEQADMAKLCFSKLYNQNQSLDDVIKKVPEQAEASLNQVVDFCVKTLIEHDILMIDNITFRERYPAYQELWVEPYMKVFDLYAEIVLDQKHSTNTVSIEGKADLAGLVEVLDFQGL